MSLKIIMKRIALFFLTLIALKNILFALPFNGMERFKHFYSTVIDTEELVVHNTLSFLIGVIMLLLIHSLYKKVRFAWCIEIALLFINIVLQITRNHRFTVPIVLVDIFVLLVLCVSYKDFPRKADRISVKKSFVCICVSLFVLLLNATIGLFLIRGHIHGIHDIGDAFINTVKLLIFLDNNTVNATGTFAKVYVFSLTVINWIFMISALLLFLKPVIINPIITRNDREKVRDLVLEYGQNPMAYLSLEEDKRYFYGENCLGVCSYKIVNDVFVVCGDMICDKENGSKFLKEIMTYCEHNAYQIMFINITDYFYSVYSSAGFGIVKYGEDCCFELSQYKLEGGKVAKVRAAINHATKAGISIIEYKPKHNKDEDIEKQINDITEEWLKCKGGYELEFTIGGTGLKEPMDRRYFYANDLEGNMLGFVVFLPYKDGYLADVTRRRNDAPQGVLEKIIYEAFMIFKEEGVLWGNMGLSPLYNIAENDKATLTEKLFTYVYDHMNNGYGFQQLHHAKEKYAPTHWMPRYLTFYPKPFSAKLALVLVASQIKAGLSKLVLSEVLKK